MAVNVNLTNSTPTENISRHVLLQWVNDTLDCNLSKIEDLCTGAAYVQMIHMLFGRKFPKINPILKKVKFSAKLVPDYITNWKVFQNAFSSLEVTKKVEVDRIMKGKFQDNFEFLQWFKFFFDTNYDPAVVDDYDPLGERGGQVLEGPGGPGKARSTGPKRPAAGKQAQVRPIAKTSPKAPAPKMTIAQPAQQRKGSLQSAGDAARIEALQSELTELQLTVTGLEKERDFYFGKLRDIEVLCQEGEDDVHDLLKKNILGILYATEEGFAPPEDEEEDGEHDEY